MNRAHANELINASSNNQRVEEANRQVEVLSYKKELNNPRGFISNKQSTINLNIHHSKIKKNRGARSAENSRSISMQRNSTVGFETLMNTRRTEKERERKNS